MSDNIWLALLFPAGMLAGTVNVLAGGGSFLTLPVLMASGLPIEVANGTNRIAVVLQGLVATRNYQKKGEFSAQLYSTLLPPLLCGALLGAFLATQIDPQIARRTFGVLFLGMALVLLFKKKPQEESAETPTVSEPAGHSFRYPAMFAVGVYGGFIQAGVGLWILLTATSLFGRDALQANAVKLPLTLTFSVPALALFAWAGLVELVPGLLLALGTVAGTLIGVRLSIRGGARLIWRAVTVVLLLTGGQLLFGN